jgi:hypothetical protein
LDGKTSFGIEAEGIVGHDSDVATVFDEWKNIGLNTCKVLLFASTPSLAFLPVLDPTRFE